MSWYNKFYASDRETEKYTAELLNSYDMSHITFRIESAESEIRDMQEAIKRCQRFLSAAHYHKQHATETKYRYQAYYTRHNYSKVYYYTGVYVIPCIPNGEEHKYSIEAKRWEGKDRHTAKAHCKELAKKYNCPIVERS